MPTGAPGLNVPRIYDGGGNQVHGYRVDLTTSASDTHTNAIFPGCFTVADTNGQRAITTSDTTVDFFIQHVYGGASGQATQGAVHDPGQCALKADLETSGAVYRLEGFPVGGLIFEMAEDGVGGAISAWATTPYVDLIFTNPTSTVNKLNPTAGVTGTILIDSSTANASSSNLAFQIVGLSPRADNNGTLKIYLVKAITAGQSQ